MFLKVQPAIRLAAVLMVLIGMTMDHWTRPASRLGWCGKSGDGSCDQQTLVPMPTYALLTATPSTQFSPAPQLPAHYREKLRMDVALWWAIDVSPRLSKGGTQHMKPTQDVSKLTPPHPLLRRLGRGALRLLRPLSAPLLSRLEMRMRTAVEQSHLSEGIARLLEQQKAARAPDQWVGPLSTSLSEQLDQLDARSRMLQISVETLRVEMGRLAEQLSVLHPAGSPLLVETASTQDTLPRSTTFPVGRDYLVRTPHGYVLTPSEDLVLLVALNESGGCLEPGTTKVVQALADSEDWVLDVGAHIGLLTLPMARSLRDGGKVVAVEPSSRMHALLDRTLVLNGIRDRVITNACAAGAQPGSGILNIGPILGHSSLLPLEGADHTEEVRICCLDDLVPAGQSVRLAKLDAEGFELQVWAGMSRIISENPELAVVVELGPTHLARAGVTIPEWIGTFLKPGFTAYEIDESSAHLRPLRAIDELSEVYSINLLLLRYPPDHYPNLTSS